MGEQGVIYKIENLINGKVYIGQTVRDYNTRIYEHKYKLDENTHYNIHLQSSWNKHGPDKFEFTLVKRCVLSELDELERMLIEYYRNKNGVYNIESGGHLSKKLSKSTIAKIVESNYRPVILLNTHEEFSSIKEAAIKYKVSQQGITTSCRRLRNFAGRMPNGEWMVWRYKEDFDENEKVSFKKDTANNKKIVICLNTKEVFESAVEAGKKFNIKPKNINSCCRGERKSCLGENGIRLQFVFYEEGEEYDLVDLGELHTERRSVICETTNEIFKSVYQASKKYEIDIRRLTNCCKGRYTYAGKLPNGTKLKWAYYKASN